MTTIYELEKQATPGPWTDDDWSVRIDEQADMVKDDIGTGQEWQAIGGTDEEGLSCVTALCHPTNARLLVHYRNHFIEALKALKTVEAQFAGYAMRIAPADEGNDIILGGLEKVIKKLETVS